MPNQLKFVPVLLGLLFLNACMPTPVPPAPTTVITALPGVTQPPTPVPAYTLLPPTPTHTPLPPPPTDTPLPPAPTQTPALTSLNPGGPYVIFFAHSGIWVTNPDGSFATQLSDYDIDSVIDFHRLISPTGDRLALVVSNEQGLDLVIISIPGGEQETVAHLIDSPPAGAYDATSANSFATYAIRDYDSLAWQPGEGRMLAFIGAMNGPTADLYVYDTQNKEITQLTDGPSQAFMPFWSPDGQYIVQYGVRWVPPFGGAILGPTQIDGVWAVRVSDGEVISLPKPVGNVPHFVGWQDDSHFITFDPGDCYSENLRSIDIVTGEAVPILENTFWYEIALSPENGGLLFSSKAECASSLGEGVYLLLPGGGSPARLLDKRAWEIYWLPESKVFNAYPEALFSSDGTIRYSPPVYDASYKPAVSKQGYQAWNVIQNRAGRVEVKVPGGEWKVIMNGSVEELIWDPVDGKTLLIATDKGFIYSATYPDFVAQLVSNIGGGVFHAIWLP